MTSLVLFQLAFNVLTIAFLGLLWSRLRHLTGEEGKLKHGLQILQTKIAILEDLSRKVDEQTQQAMQMLEFKKRAIENSIEEAEIAIQKIDQKSLLASSDSETILERENAIKFTKAAILANRGVSPKEISNRLNLGIQESELIFSLNSHQLQFKLDELPGWMLPHIQENTL